MELGKAVDDIEAAYRSLNRTRHWCVVSGEWHDGQRFSSGASEDEVRTWAKTL